MHAGGSVLVVDDDDLNLKVLSRFVGSLGCEVYCADNGLAALKQVRENPIDLILLDIMMPQVDGFSVLTSLKADPSTVGIPVLVISAFDDSSNVVRCIEAGADDFMTKPFNSHLLKARVQACLTKRKLQERESEYCREVEANNLRLEQHSEERIAPIADSRHRLSLILHAQHQLMRRLALLTENVLPETSNPGDWLTDIDCKSASSSSLSSHGEQIIAIARGSLFLSALADRADAFAKCHVGIRQILSQATSQVQKVASERHITIEPAPPMDLDVVGDLELLSSAFAVVLRQSIEWSADASRIDVVFEVANNRLITLLHSAGAFVPRDELLRIYDLRRSERRAPDFGPVGPALAQAIIEICGGQIALDSMDDGVFQMIELPIYVA